MKNKLLWLGLGLLVLNNLAEEEKKYKDIKQKTDDMIKYVKDGIQDLEDKLGLKNKE